MNKSELIESLSSETGFSKRDIGIVLKALSDNVTRTLRKGGKVQWSGFGTFSLSRRGARNGINPQTKQVIRLPQVYVPKFKPGKNLKETVNKTSV
ncbi:MAG: HU family DNA-binding protein [Candidatus Dependentiae bacterium]|nr:HU family DNA-binding protein [Candidatus Dependentiae bacterium]